MPIPRQLLREQLLLRLLAIILGTNFLLLGGLASVAEEKQSSPRLLPDDPELAWAEVDKVHQALQPPPDWRSHTPKPEEAAAFQKQVQQAARSPRVCHPLPSTRTWVMRGSRWCMRSVKP